MAITIGAEIKTDPGSLTRQLRRDAGTVESTLGKAFNNVGKTATSVFNTVGTTIRKAVSVRNLVIGGFAGFGFDRLVRASTELDVKVSSLSHQVGKAIPEINRYIATVNSSSLGLLDFATASEVANRALLAGIPQSRVAELARYSAAVSTARGESDRFVQSFPQLVKTIAGGETGLLKDFGVFIDPADLKGIGFAERNAKILQLTIDQLERKAKKLGVTGRETYFQYVGIFGSVQDIALELGRAYTRSESFKTSVQQVGKIVAGLADSLRENGLLETLQPVAQKLVELFGALAGDLGDAIAKGVGRGFRLGLELIGVDIEKTLGKAAADRINTFLDESIDFSRTSNVLDSFGKAFESPSIGPATDPTADRKKFNDELKRIREIDDALKRGRGNAFRNAVDAERQNSRLNDDGAAPEEIERRAREKLKRERQQLLRSTRGGATSQGDELRRVEREIRQREERLNGLPDNAPQSVRDRRQRELDNLKTNRDSLVRELGLSDPRKPAEKVNEQQQVKTGDSLGQVISKAFTSGILADSALKTEVVGWFDEGMTAGLGKIVTELGPVKDEFLEQLGSLVTAAATSIGDAISNAASDLVNGLVDTNWMGIGELMAAGFLDWYWANFKEGAKAAGSGLTGVVDVRSKLSDSLRQRLLDSINTKGPMRPSPDRILEQLPSKTPTTTTSQDESLVEPLSKAGDKINDATNQIEKISMLIDQFAESLA